MAVRLKVFRAEMGFYEAVVAAASQKSALEAWGTHQNLFHSGMAAVTQDEEAVKAAVARPGVVFRRPAGSNGPFQLASDALLAKPRSSPKPEPKNAAPRRKAKPPPRPDRSDIEAAERALKAIDAEHRAELAQLAKAQSALDKRRDDLIRTYDARRKAAERAAQRASDVYSKALAKR